MFKDLATTWLTDKNVQGWLKTECESESEANTIIHLPKNLTSCVDKEHSDQNIITKAYECNLLETAAGHWLILEIISDYWRLLLESED